MAGPANGAGRKNGHLHPASGDAALRRSGEVYKDPSLTGYPRVVIVGAGFAGMEVARALASAPVDVLLLDKHNHHCFQPLLYQVATATLSPTDIAWPVRSIVARQKNARVVMDEVLSVDTDSRIVRAMRLGAVAYDYLVLATGATHSYFGHPEWGAFAPGLKRIEDATRIRQKILGAFEAAETEPDETERQRLLTFVIVGGGPTGVELAGAAADMARYALARDFRRINTRSARILLLEAGPRLLPGLDTELSEYARRTLVDMGVNVRLGTAVTACDAAGVEAGAARIEAATVIWAAGVKASDASRWIAAKADRAGRIIVADDLSVPGLGNVFAVGDTAAAFMEGGRPVPGIAPAAKQMGQYVGRLIARRVCDPSASSPPFRYRHRGDFATIGRRAAVAVIGGMRFRGTIAWLLWSVAHVYFLIEARSRVQVAVNWLWEYTTLKRGARLITGSVAENDAGQPAAAPLVSRNGVPDHPPRVETLSER